MSNEAAATFEHDGAKVTVITRPTNRQRDVMRGIYRKLAEAEPTVSAGTAIEFASIVAYTTSVEGKLWKPPSSHAPAEELVEAFRYWMDEIEANLTDKWIKAIEGNA